MGHESTIDTKEENSTTAFTLPHLFDVSQLVIVLKEEGEVLVGDIHRRVATVLLMLLLCVTTSGESIFGDLELKGEREEHLLNIVCNGDIEKKVVSGIVIKLSLLSQM